MEDVPLHSSAFFIVHVSGFVFLVHQADLSDTEKMLRQFDLTTKYGPCTDMSRLERWERAFNLVWGREPQTAFPPSLYILVWP